MADYGAFFDGAWHRLRQAGLFAAAPRLGNPSWAEASLRVLVLRLSPYRELVALVTSAVFAACDDYAWLSQMPFHMNAPRLVLAATK